MVIEIHMAGAGAAKRLSFPSFEGDSRLGDLVRCISSALGTNARPPTGSPLEWLVGFEAYPEEFALWWDGFTCELGCSAPCGVEMDAIADILIASGAFAPT